MPLRCRLYSRVGKIARLPDSIREGLNVRILDGWPGEALLEWLHTQSAVQVILKVQFKGRQISHQNLSKWRNGGYATWLRKREEMEIRQILSS